MLDITNELVAGPEVANGDEFRLHLAHNSATMQPLLMRFVKAGTISESLSETGKNSSSSTTANHLNADNNSHINKQPFVLNLYDEDDEDVAHEKYIPCAQEKHPANDKLEVVGRNQQEVNQQLSSLILSKSRESSLERAISENTDLAINKDEEIVDDIKYTTEDSSNCDNFNINQYYSYAVSNNVDELRDILNYFPEHVDIVDSYGWSALMMASCAGSLEAVQVLLEHGADRDLADKSGKTAMDFAIIKGNLEIVVLLDSSSALLEEEGATGLDDEANENDIEVDSDCVVEPFYCDICARMFMQSTWNEHQNSIIHIFNSRQQAHEEQKDSQEESVETKSKQQKDTVGGVKAPKFNLSTQNKGYQMMMKQGWDAASGLGPQGSGRLYPVETTIRKERSGLGIEQKPARVTHTKSLEKKKARTRHDMRREKRREWELERKLRRELS